MDPNETLTSAIVLARTIVDSEASDDNANELAELVLALDEWLTKGGFYPDAWGNAPRPACKECKNPNPHIHVGKGIAVTDY